MAEKELGLAEAIQQLRNELNEAVSEGKGKGMRFQIREIDVELKCLVKNKTGGKAGIKFWVVTTEAKGFNTSEAVQTVKLKLLPTNKKGKPVLLSNVGEVK